MQMPNLSSTSCTSSCQCFAQTSKSFLLKFQALLPKMHVTSTGLT